MKKNIYLLFLVFCLNVQAQVSLNKSQKNIVLNNNAFALDFLKLFNKQSNSDNFVFSPFSLSATFAMAYAGSANETEKQLQKTFGFAENQSSFHQDFGTILQNFRRYHHSSYQILVDNVAFVDQKYAVKSLYKNELIKNYLADFQVVNFSNQMITHKQINDWGKQKSKGMIKEMLSEYNSQIKILLANLTFFEANWTTAFEENKTQNDYFYTPHKTIQTPFMHKEEIGQYKESQNWKLVGLPIQVFDDPCSIIILMPNQNEDLNTLIENMPTEVSYFLDNQEIRDVFDEIPTIQMRLALPKFEIDNKIKPLSILQKMGISDAFNQNKADFSKITDDPKGLFISILQQQCRVLVNEKGIKAAASTAVAFQDRSMSKGIEVKINKPFIFFIRDDTSKSILFVGKVNEPVVAK